MKKKIPIIYCINLDRRPDRWNFMKEQFEKHSLMYYRFSAVDGKKQFSNLSDNYKKGWLACLVSHLKILQKMIDEEIKDMIILEDDAILHEEFEKRVIKALSEIPEGPIFCYLGGSNIQKPELFSENVSICKETLSTVGYYINLEFVKSILFPFITEVSVNKEIDSLYTDLQKQQMMYILSPRVVYQKEDYSDIQSNFVNYSHQKDF